MNGINTYRFYAEDATEIEYTCVIHVVSISCKSQDAELVMNQIKASADEISQYGEATIQFGNGIVIVYSQYEGNDDNDYLSGNGYAFLENADYHRLMNGDFDFDKFKPMDN